MTNQGWEPPPAAPGGYRGQQPEYTATPQQQPGYATPPGRPPNYATVPQQQPGYATPPQHSPARAGTAAANAPDRIPSGSSRESARDAWFPNHGVGDGNSAEPNDSVTKPWTPVGVFKSAWVLLASDFTKLGLPLVATVVLTLVGIGAVWLVVHLIVMGALLLLPLLDLVDPNSSDFLERIDVSILLAQYVADAVLIAYATAGMTSFSLEAARGNKPPFTSIFKDGFRYIIPATIIGLLSNIFATVAIIGTLSDSVPNGFVFLLILSPNIFTAPLLYLSLPFAIHKKFGTIHSMIAGLKLFKDNFGRVFLVTFLGIFGGLFMTLITCNFGIFVLVPVFQLAGAYMYLRMTQQRTFEDT